MTDSGGPTASPEVASDGVASVMRDAVIVTGAHYSMTSVVGAVLAEARDTRLVHEPFNPEPTLGYATIGTPGWYRYVGGADVDRTARALVDVASGRAARGELLRRARSVRSAHDVLRVGKFQRDRVVRQLSPGRPVFKDPFMVFAAPALQRRFRTRVVLCVRHPCGFAESIARRAGGFDFAALSSQDDLLDALGCDAEAVRRAAADGLPALEAAGLLWRIVYSFASRHLLDDGRTLVVRQEDLAADPGGRVEELYEFAELVLPRPSESLATAYTRARRGVVGRRSYVRRDASAAAGTWRRRLSIAEQQTVLDAVGEIATTFGYGS